MRIRTVPSGVRNGLPERTANYVYRGTGANTLTPELDRPSPPLGRFIAPHGTKAAARRHRRHGEKPCPACAEAERRDTAGRAAARRRQS